MFVDKNNDKRYTYPSNIYIDPSDSTGKFLRYQPLIPKGDLYLNLSLPYVNHFYFVPAGERTKQNAGFIGFAAGLDFYFRNNRFLSVMAAIATDFPVPFPAHIDYSGEHQTMSSVYITVSNHYKIRRFSIGYGLSFSRNTWNLIYDNRFNPPPPAREPVSKSNYGFGLPLPVQYHIGNKFYIGMNYQPTLYHLSSRGKFKYEHLLSMQFGWRIKV
jgi:hypothetical protein